MHEDPKKRQLGIDYLKLCVDVAQAVGSPHVAGPMYSATGKARLLPSEERQQQCQWAADNLREVADYAAERGITFAIEPLNRSKPTSSTPSSRAWNFASLSAVKTSD